MILVYVVVPVGRDPLTLLRVREAVARPWLEAYREHVRYWVETLGDAENELAVLALAGFRATVEPIDPREAPTTEK
jgi:hypothetical protein